MGWFGRYNAGQKPGGSLERLTPRVLVWAAISSIAFAQEGTTVPPVRPFVLPPRIGVFMDARLTLDQALAMALANNKDIDSSRIDQAKALYNVLAAKGSYDPRAGANAYFQKAITPVASSLGGSPTGALLNRTWLG